MQVTEVANYGSEKKNFSFYVGWIFRDFAAKNRFRAYVRCVTVDRGAGVILYPAPKSRDQGP